MFRKTLLAAVALSALITTNLFAQTEVANDVMGGEPAEMTLISERVAFVKAFYSLSPDQLTKLQKDLESRIETNQKYMQRNELMIRRRTTAISAVLPQDKTLDAERIESLRSQYQEQIYRIREAAPLSLTNAVRTAEDMLGADARKAGREKVEKYFAKQLNGQPLDPAHMDRLILTPVPMLDISQSDRILDTQEKLMGNQPARSTTAEKLAANRPSAKEIQAAKEAAMKAKLEAAKNDPHAGHDHAEAPPAAASRQPEVPDLEAPPLDQWAGVYQTWATNYQFSPEQKATAESIYSHCMGQAQSRMKDAQSLLEKAKAMPEGAERTKAVQTAMQPINAVFTQMKLRIDSVASVEQRERFKADQKAEGNSSESNSDEKKS
ncbi:MAG: hypothetical protein H6819_08180 [Phycisphaerales bacterium]|nr:hypothetical protein [Phycisphaerales bacterium]MCB9854247.1 hypothetical protein [Phycisphaerales bacterium]MCB9864745.1 hypothetical protein [Phycisphaerales bacterium]